MKVKLSNYSNRAGVVMELVDDLGPWNSWKGPEGFTPAGGTLAIGSNAIVARGCGIVPCWEMHGAVWGKLKVGDTGTGLNNVDHDDLESGDIHWRIVAA